MTFEKQANQRIRTDARIDCGRKSCTSNTWLGLDPQIRSPPRPYTLTHSDITAELFLTIGPDCNESQICGWYTRLMRDEVLAEWKGTDEGPALHVYCHVSGGFVFGSAPLRYKIFQDELPLVLEALRYGDSSFFAPHPQLDNAPSGFTSSQQCLGIM